MPQRPRLSCHFRFRLVVCVFVETADDVDFGFRMPRKIVIFVGGAIDFVSCIPSTYEMNINKLVMPPEDDDK